MSRGCKFEGISDALPLDEIRFKERMHMKDLFKIGIQTIWISSLLYTLERVAVIISKGYEIMGYRIENQEA